MQVLSIIIPVFNEEANLNLLFERLKNTLQKIELKHEIIFVNDGSTDNSIGIIHLLASTDPCVRYLDLSRNFGQQIAISAGLDKCCGDRIAILDADLQDPPELIKEMLEKMNEGFEVVYAKRKKRQGEGALKQLTAKVFYRLLSSLTSFEIPLDTGDFRLIDKRVAEALKQMPEKSKFLRGQIAWVGFRQTFIEYERQERHAGTSGYTYGKMIRFAIDGITSFSDIPLKLVTYFGFIVSGIAFLVMLYALYSKFVSHDFVKGWTSTILSVLFLGGIQLISIGIIGEYISRINTDVRNRPLYIIRDSNSVEKKD